AAEALANEIKEKVTAENFDEIAKEYWTKVDPDNEDVEFTTRLTSGKLSDTSSVYGEWYNSEAITEGTKIVLDNTDVKEYIVALYTGRSREEIETVNVRHILIGATTEIDEDLSAEEKAETEKAKTEAKEKADKLLADFLAGDKTAEAFGKLADENTQDTGSFGKGGLYENVAPGEMVEAFDAWIFDEARKVGDTAVVETEHGYHVMYFEGAGELQYIVNIKNTIASEKYTEKYTAFSEGMEAKDHNFGMMLAF
ncbi:MAG: peptidylprolyl isomerase, partial [Clostridia bacterium]|nr:peptidylprolyl isomerase [Clostridia bacterium]